MYKLFPLFASTCIDCICTVLVKKVGWDMCICRPSPSNQSFYMLIAAYQRGAGRPMMRGVMGLQISCSATMHLQNNVSNSCTMYAMYNMSYYVSVYMYMYIV